MRIEHLVSHSLCIRVENYNKLNIDFLLIRLQLEKYNLGVVSSVSLMKYSLNIPAPKPQPDNAMKKSNGAHSKNSNAIITKLEHPSFTFLLFLFLGLACIVTALATSAPYILNSWGIISVPKPSENHWGGLGDWYSGVLGISVGFAGTAIAIWLAYRVEALSSHQAKLTQIQTVIDMAKEEGSISRRCDWARVAANHVDTLFSSIQRLISNDLTYGEADDQQSEAEDRLSTVNTDSEDPYGSNDDQYERPSSLDELRGQHMEKAKTEYTKIFSSLRGLEAVLSAATVQFSADEIAEALGLSLGELPSDLKPYLEKFIDYQGEKGPESSDEYLKQLAIVTCDTIKRSNEAKQPHPGLNLESQLACIRFLIAVSSTGSQTNALDNVYYRNYQADRSETVWDALALWGKSSAGDIFRIDPYCNYLPRTEFNIDCNESVVIDFIPSLISAAIEALNPVKHTEETLKLEDTSVLLGKGDFIPVRLQDILRAPLTNLAKKDPSFYRSLARIRPAPNARITICVIDHTPNEVKSTKRSAGHRSVNSV